MMRVTGDSFAVQTMIMNGLLPILSSAGAAGRHDLGAGADRSALLTALALTIVPVLFVLIAVFNRKIADIATTARDNDSLVYSVVQWGMGSIKLVQALHQGSEGRASPLHGCVAARRSEAHRLLYASARPTLFRP